MTQDGLGNDWLQEKKEYPGHTKWSYYKKKRLGRNCQIQKKNSLIIRIRRRKTTGNRFERAIN